MIIVKARSLQGTVPESSMTEPEWLEAIEPVSMLNYLGSGASCRKLRLLACASSRRVWHLLTDERSREAVEVAERYADGHANDEDLAAARREAEQGAFHLLEKLGAANEKAKLAILRSVPIGFAGVAPLAAAVLLDQVSAATSVVAATINTPGIGAAMSWNMEVAAAQMDMRRSACAKIMEDLHRQSTDNGAEPPKEFSAETFLTAVERSEHLLRVVEREKRTGQCALIRDIFGNPFRPANLEPSWRTPAVVALAETLYDHRDFERLPELAHVLEEVGCRDADIIGHCRAPGPHVRGCWVLDLLLGKE